VTPTIHSPSTAAEAADILLAAVATTAVLDVPIARRLLEPEHVRTSLSNRNRRPEWVWTARRQDRDLARVAAWGAPLADRPAVLDLVDIGEEPDRVTVLGALLRSVAERLAEQGVDPVELDLTLPAHWRELQHPLLADLQAALEHAGFRPLVARKRFTVEDLRRLPAERGRLRFQPVAAWDDPTVVGVHRRTLEGSLDEHTREAARTSTPTEIALDDLAFMRDFNGPVEHWRIGVDAEGDPVGLVTGSAAENALIGYVGVVPEHRGHGYAADLLAWMARHQLSLGSQRTTGETDDDNVPMWRTFLACGFQQESARIDYRWRPEA
jgi:GNAT superfamily N-acetyltransferase